VAGVSGTAVGVDLGGTKLAAGVVDRAGRVLYHDCRPTPAAGGASAVLAALVAATRDMLAWAQRSGTAVQAVGLGVAGQVDPAGRITHATATLPGWAGTDVRAAVAAAVDRPVTVLNDVHALAVGEHAHGAAAGARDALVVAVGTGIGGAIIHDGRLVVGRTGMAGLVGHLPAPGRSGRSCPCGRADHLEAYASGPAIAADYAARAGLAAVPDLPAVAAAARAGDRLAAAAITDAATLLGRGLGGLLTLLEPDVLVLGGGVTELAELFLPALTAGLRAEALPGPDRTPVRPAHLGPLAGVVGAATAALVLPVPLRGGTP
jgi:glucokinase